MWWRPARPAARLYPASYLAGGPRSAAATEHDVKMPWPAGQGSKTSKVIRHDRLHRAPDTQERGIMIGTVFLAMPPAAIGFALSPSAGTLA